MLDAEVKALHGLEALCGTLTTLVEAFLAEHENALPGELREFMGDILDIADESLQAVEELGETV